MVAGWQRLVIAIRLAALVPLAAGAAGMASGFGFLGEVGMGAAADSHARYLSGLLFGIGLGALWCTAALPDRAPIFNALCGVVIVGGLARAAGLVLAGLPPWPHLAALGMELGVVPLLLLACRRLQAAHA